MCAGEESDKDPYIGFKMNRVGIWPFGVAVHTGRKSNDGTQIYGLQFGILFCSFWIAVKKFN